MNAAFGSLVNLMIITYKVDIMKFNQKGSLDRQDFQAHNLLCALIAFFARCADENDSAWIAIDENNHAWHDYFETGYSY